MALTPLSAVTDLEGKRVLVRVDYNVPLEKGVVVDDTRLRATLPTIEYLLKQNARIILLTHVGRPEGKKVRSLSTAPIAKALWQLLGVEVMHVPDIVGKKAINAVKTMPPGQIILLENVRFSPEEQKNTGTLAMDMAALGDLYVLDGFAVAHRASASVVGLAHHLPSYAGLLLEKEITGLSAVTQDPKSPFCAVLGGAKIETKIPVLEALIPKADIVLLGGGLVNTCLAAQGYGIGDSLVDKDFIQEAGKYAAAKNVLLPIDLVVGEPSGRQYRTIDIGDEPHALCASGEGIFDIGPKTVQLYATHIKKAQTLVWNGAMGYFEQEPYHVATYSIARLVASRSKGEAFGVIGGGETLQAMDATGMGEYVDLISTGGGAMLEFLAGKELPGIVAIGG